MRGFSLAHQITPATSSTLAKAALLGLLGSEVYFFGHALGRVISEHVQVQDAPLAALIVTTAIVLFIAVYVSVRNGKEQSLRILRSYRFDLLAMTALGSSISVAFDGIGTTKYENLLEDLLPAQALLLSSVPLVAGALILLRAIPPALFKAPPPALPFFMSDLEQESTADDLLDLSEDAQRFAERVLNGGSQDSIVFGVDAPWGIGKSSFVNFCIEYWQKRHAQKAIVYKFNVLQYEESTSLVEKFVDGLVRTIHKHIFVPEIRPLVTQYSRFLKGRGALSQFGIDLQLQPPSYTADDAFEDLRTALARIDRKIIIVVDDLDRVSLDAIKRILFAIKKSFTLPNISYVLCYDTENIISGAPAQSNGEKIREFLEKFVNVKVSIFLHTDTLARYITDNFDRAAKNNLQVDPYTLAQTKEAISAIRDIYKSPDFHQYQPLLGDIRKLKRLVNTLILFEIEKTDFENSDIDKRDLIHLLLIYINFPEIFRKIYTTETDGKRGFFSLVTKHDDGYPEDTDHDKARYKNSRYYLEYVGSLSPAQKALLEKIFSSSLRLGNQTEQVSEEQRNSYACFNGSSYGGNGRNLEAYLNLIVKLSKPQRREQYRFYLNSKNRLLSGESIEAILQGDEFSFAHNETNHREFWRIVVNSANEYGPTLGNQLIQHLLDHVQDYSLLGHDALGNALRDDIPLFIIKLLDTTGWSDARGQHRDNTSENIAEIAEWIFGEGRHVGHGVVETLSKLERGSIGFFDLMIFRLYCCADRGGSFFNLQRALTLHADPKGPTGGALSTIVVAEMRQLSQRIFALFKEQYISPRRNFFELVDDLTVEVLCGKYYDYVQRLVASKQVGEDELRLAVDRAKTRLNMFVMYQLTNKKVSSGIGCGYYDETGKLDQHGIAQTMNEYIFGRCFNPAMDSKAPQYFLDYLLSNFSGPADLLELEQYEPTIDGFTKILERKRLAKYWKEHSSSVRAFADRRSDRRVVGANYIASYAEDLVPVYKVLDQLVRRPGMSIDDTADPG